MDNNYNKFINTNRLGKSTDNRRKRNVEHFYSDKSKIIYSSSFRRLQQKAQVFSLESNASVRTRLTHSLEVSNIGRKLADKISRRLKKENKLAPRNILPLASIVENACLLHDIGNPPFGHFGEAAIREWAKYLKKHLPENIDNNNSLLNILITDFEEFDGNPQDFRIVTRLHTDLDVHSLNLTYSTLLCMLKYPRTPGYDKNTKLYKKAGYFHTEENIVKKIYEELNMTPGFRYPFVYIMEAADDIAYCMSDIADGIEKGIITEIEFVEEFEKEWHSLYGEIDSTITIPKQSNLKGFTYDFSIPWSRQAIEEAANRFIDLADGIYLGKAESLISKENTMGKVLEIMKKVSRRILYKSFEAESIEISGYAVITGILNVYTKILEMNYDDFSKILEDKDINGYDFEKRLIHFIGNRYIIAYHNALGEFDKNKEDYYIREWWLRVHLIIDHISGMTDQYALQTYQMLKGISIMR